MPFRIVTTTNARKDIKQAINWENERSSDLGVRFLNDLEQRLETISQTPAIGSVRYDNVRCTTTNIFQYLIHYTVDDKLKQITILRVLHIRQKPIW